MANVKISALPSISSLSGSELIPVVQSGTTSQITAANLKAYAGGSSSPAGAGSPGYSNVWVFSTKADSFWTSYSLTGTIKQMFSQTGSPVDLTVSSQTAYGRQLSSGDKILGINDAPIHTNSTYGIVVEFPASPSVGDTFAVPLICPTTTVNAGSFVVGTEYVIVTLGTTDFSSIGATSPYPGQTFTATGVGSGTGTATTVSGVTKLIFKPASGQQLIISSQSSPGSSGLVVGTGGSGIAAYLDLVSGFGAQPISWVYAGVISGTPTWYQTYF